jgi:hypothetical protein
MYLINSFLALNVLLEKEPKVKAPSIFFFRKKETKKPLP